MPTPRPEHDKIRAWWASDISLEACWKMYDGANVPRWNLEIEPFVIR
jgi:hypothetical protein